MLLLKIDEDGSINSYEWPGGKATELDLFCHVIPNRYAKYVITNRYTFYNHTFCLSLEFSTMIWLLLFSFIHFDIKKHVSLVEITGSLHFYPIIYWCHCNGFEDRKPHLTLWIFVLQTACVIQPIYGTIIVFPPMTTWLHGPFWRVVDQTEDRPVKFHSWILFQLISACVISYLCISILSQHCP